MPYSGQTAGKSGHSDIVSNPDIKEFLGDCDFLHPPSDDEAKAIVKCFSKAPTSKEPLPKMIVAIDGSVNEAFVSDMTPSTRIGYVKISSVAIDVEHYIEPAKGDNPFIDPFVMARVGRDTDAFSIALPSTNVRFPASMKDKVANGFRRKLAKEFSSSSTEIGKCGRTFMDTLFSLAARTGNIGGTDGSGKPYIRVYKCGNCEEKHAGGVVVKPGAASSCPRCGGDIFATDSLRVHETVSDFAPNMEAMSRLMLVTEHILFAHYLLSLMDDGEWERLSELCFILDGTLSVNGEPAWVHAPILKLIHQAWEELDSRGLRRFLVIGLQKTGQIMEFASMMSRFIEPNTLYCVDDDFRNTYIRQHDGGGRTFGDRTHYGQDFVFKTESGAIFSVLLPYPWPDKSDATASASTGKTFTEAKADAANYPDLALSLDVIRTFEASLYDGSIVPIILAHEKASISLTPGGKVLDLMSVSMFGGIKKGKAAV